MNLFSEYDLYRTERDTFGEIEVPADRLWGAQTQRSLLHFRISGALPGDVHPRGRGERAAATVNAELGLLDAAKARAIVAAADEVITGLHAQEFPS